MAKIISRIAGGMGNQLFSYSAARRLALVNNAELILDDTSGFTRDYRFCRHYQLDHFNITSRKATKSERLEPLSRIRRFAKRAYNRRRPFEDRKYIQQKGVNFDHRLIKFKPRGTTYIEGYWQSEKYFLDVEQTLRADLRIIPPIDSPNLAIASAIQRRVAVAVHIRFFDAPQANETNNISKDYYIRSIAEMERFVPNAHYFIFSDRPNAARSQLKLPANRMTCISNNNGDINAYADLWLMSKCNHFIIANSTFSWWGAWLAETTNKCVITPRGEVHDGIMSWGFDGLLPDKWIKI